MIVNSIKARVLRDRFISAMSSNIQMILSEEDQRSITDILTNMNQDDSMSQEIFEQELT